MSFDAEHLNWSPGDIVTVRPQNSDEQVTDLFKLFEEHNFPFSETTIIQIQEIDSGKYFYLFFLIKITKIIHHNRFHHLVAIHRHQIRIAVS